ncbi:MAG: hypothetical protein NC111_03790 [Bacteroides sp.]|nr:hypothetical protein [Bacteroides sp.]MCM1413942.1 hypothetical protein [Bacteroides sp.]MCM1471631.1 hypothetical protein [Bacteroides sp.]
MSIADHIKYLVSCHDCVVVAGLGAFVAQYRPARISTDGLMLLPPERTLVFNSVISHDDGLLAGSVAKKKGISCDAAKVEVASEVETLRGLLELQGSYDIPRVGRLTLVDGRMQFVPATDNPIVNARYACYQPAQLLIASSELETAESTNVMEFVPEKRSGRVVRMLRSAGRYAAAVVVLAAVGLTLSTPIILDRTVDKASLSIPEVKPARKAVVPSPVVAPVKPAAVVSKEVVEPSAAEPAKEVKPIMMVSELGESADQSYDCYIIVASCASRGEARRFIANHGGNNTLQILPSDGRYRVYAAVANDYDAAFEFKTSDPTFKKRYPTAWVYKK